MRVLHVARYGSVRGGAETYVAALCDGLRARGHTVALAYGMEPDVDRLEVVDGFHLPGLVEPRPEPEPGDADELRAAVASFAPDIVHVHLPDVPWVAPVCAEHAPTLLAVHDHKLHCPVGTKYWTAWKRGCTVAPGPWCLGYNVVARCGSLRANATLRPYRSWRRASAAARAVAIQVFSEHIRERMTRAGFDAARVGATHYPVPPLVAPEPAPDDDERPVVLASGRLNKEKGFAELIDALAWVQTPAHVVVAGEGHEREALAIRARRAPAVHRVSFTGWLSAGALAGWTERAAIVAIPSMWPEPFGIAGLEAMARARPVVAFASGGIPEWLTPDAGFPVVPGDVAGLGHAIDELLRDPELGARMGRAGREHAEREFSMDRHLGALLPLYERAAREPAA